MTTYLSLATIASLSVLLGAAVNLRGTACAALIAVVTAGCWVLS